MGKKPKIKFCVDVFGFGFRFARSFRVLNKRRLIFDVQMNFI